MKENLRALSSVILIILIGVSGYFAFNIGNKSNNISVTYMVDNKVYEEVKLTKEENKISSLPEAPYKEGYTFKYWEYNGKEFDINEEIDGSIKITAVYEKDETTISPTPTAKPGNPVVTPKPNTPTLTPTPTVKPSNPVVTPKPNTPTITPKPNSNQTVEVTSISIPSSATIKVNEGLSLNVVVNPSNASNKTVTWTSSDTSIVIVGNGLIKGLKEGVATITAKSNNGKTATCKVTVTKQTTTNTTVNVTGITLDKASASIEVDNKLILTATINPTNASNKTVTWTSSNTSIASVNSKGEVTGIKEGTVTITAKSNNGKTATCNVTVTKKTIAVTGITLSTTNKTINVGDTLNITATVSPSNATDKTITWTSSNTSVATVSNKGVVKGLKAGVITITAKSNNGKTATCKVLVNNTKDIVNVYFINVHNNSKYTTNTKSNGEAIIIKTRDNKYVLYDTGFNDIKIKNNIYTQLKALQNKSTVVIDYMVISHSHSDHAGNVLNILNDSKISVKNVVVKKESLSPKVYNNISKNLNGATLITTNNLKEGHKINVGDYLHMYLYNVDDVYKNKSSECSGKAGYSIRYTASKSDADKIGGYYAYFDGSTFPNVKLYYSKTLPEQKSGTGMNRYFYACLKEEDDGSAAEVVPCNANANSVAVLASVETPGSNKHMYFPGDLDNNGYGFTLGESIYGPGTQIVYENLKYDTSLKKFTTMLPRVKVASETNVAKAIKAKLGDNIKYITIYQQSHHGINNSLDALKTLNLNRSGVYAIMPSISITSNSFLKSSSYYYKLNKTKQLYTGGTDKLGVKCTINYSGSTSCSEWK